MHGIGKGWFRTGPKRAECGRILPGAEFVCAAVLLVEKTAAGEPGGEIRASASSGVHHRCDGRLADRTPAAEWSEPDDRARILSRTCAGAVGRGGSGWMIGLPSLQALDRAQAARIWMASEPTDMRCGFDRLAERVRAVIGENPQSGHLFVFRSRRADRLKILVWDRDGFVLWYKRLEVGIFKLPRVEQGARSVELRASELAMVLDGIDVSKLKRVARYQRASHG